MLSFFTEHLDILIAFFLSMLPLIELRGGIIYAAARGIPFLPAAIICYLGTLVPVPFILLFLRKAFEIMERFSWSKRIVDWLENHARKREKTYREPRRVLVPRFYTRHWYDCVRREHDGDGFKNPHRASPPSS